MKTKLLIFAISAFLFAGCKNERIDESVISSKSNISQEAIKESQNLDKASYAGLEHLFGDTANISSDGKFVLLIFGKNNCQWCDRLKDDIKADKKTQALLEKNFKTYYINLSYSKIHNLNFDGKTSQKETSELSSEYNIRPTPTSIFLDSSGHPIFGWPGYFTQEQMHVVLDFIASKDYQKAKNQQELFGMLSKRLEEVK